MNVCVVGTGYVGLVTGACFAEFGNDVVCVDVDKQKIDNLNKGILPIYEPGLDVMVARNVKEGRLTFTTDIKSAVEKSLVIFIAVGTPSKEDGSADMQYVEQVAKDVAKYMNGFKVIVNKSTVPVGAGKWIKEVIKKHQTSPWHFAVASNPEFLREGSAIEDFMRPDRVVIGSDSEEAIAILEENAGSTLDPHFTAVFIEMLRRGAEPEGQAPDASPEVARAAGRGREPIGRQTDPAAPSLTATAKESG